MSVSNVGNTSSYVGYTPTTTPLSTYLTSSGSGTSTASDSVLPSTSTSSSSSSGSEQQILALIQEMLTLLEKMLASETSGSGTGSSSGLGSDSASASSGTGAASSGSGAASSGSGTGNSVGSSGGAASSNGSAGGSGSLSGIDQKYGSMIDKALAANGNPNGITKKFVEAEIMQESSGDANAVGDGGSSLGLLQINNNDAAYTSGKFAGGNRDDAQTNIDMAVEDMGGYAAQGYSLGGVANAYEDGGDPAGIGDGYGASVLSIMNGS
jgi:hypothetical protein